MPDQSKTFTVPQGVRDAAKRGLELRREHGRGGLDARQAKKEGVGSGVQRASNLIQGKVTYKTVKRMLAFFNRHKAFKEHHSDKTSAAWISHMLWGGNPGYAWAKRIVKQEERVEKGSFTALTLGLDDHDPVWDEPIGGEPIGGEPILSFATLLKSAKAVKAEVEEITFTEPSDSDKTFVEIANDAAEAKEILDDDGELSELTEEDAKRLHEADPMIIPPQPSDSRNVSKSLDPEDNEEDYDETWDAIEYNPVIVLDNSALNPHIKRAMKLRDKMSKSSTAAKKIGLAIRREQYTTINVNTIERMLDGLGSGDTDDQIEAAIVGGHIILDALEKAQPNVPDKYLDGLTGAARAKRKKQIQARIKGKQSYKEMEGDDKVKTKPSKYTKTRLASAVREEIKSSGKDEFIRAAAKISGVSRSIIEEVYDRGMRAWSTSGHRVGASAQAWAKARVYSLISGGKTRRTADKDLWEQHLENKRK